MARLVQFLIPNKYLYKLLVIRVGFTVLAKKPCGSCHHAYIATVYDSCSLSLQLPYFIDGDVKLTQSNAVREPLVSTLLVCTLFVFFCRSWHTLAAKIILVSEVRLKSSTEPQIVTQKMHASGEAMVPVNPHNPPLYFFLNSANGVTMGYG